MTGVNRMKLGDSGSSATGPASGGGARAPTPSTGIAAAAAAGDRAGRPAHAAVVAADAAESSGRSSGSEGVAPRPQAHQRSPLGRSVVTALEAQMDQVASPPDVEALDGGATPETSPSRRRQGLLATLRRRLSRRSTDAGHDFGDVSPLSAGAAAAFFRPQRSGSLPSDDER